MLEKENVTEVAVVPHSKPAKTQGELASPSKEKPCSKATGFLDLIRWHRKVKGKRSLTENVLSHLPIN